MIRLTELVRLKLDAHARSRVSASGAELLCSGKHEMPRLGGLNRDFRRF